MGVHVFPTNVPIDHPEYYVELHSLFIKKDVCFWKYIQQCALTLTLEIPIFKRARIRAPKGSIPSPFRAKFWPFRHHFFWTNLGQPNFFLVHMATPSEKKTRKWPGKIAHNNF